MIPTVTNATKKYLIKHLSTPSPRWVDEYKLKGEDEFDSKLKELQESISESFKEKNEIEGERKQLIKFKGLLYEQGPALEDLIICSFKLMGFLVKSRKVDDLERDIVFKTAEGRGIAEIESKDNYAIDITKLDQLNRAVDLDFHLNGKYPQGILIGNPHRLTNPQNRKEPFTEEVKKAAKKDGFGLLTTFEIFKAVREIIRNPYDMDFKKRCRERILETVGTIIRLVE